MERNITTMEHKLLLPNGRQNFFNRFRPDNKHRRPFWGLLKTFVILLCGVLAVAGIGPSSTAFFDGGFSPGAPAPVLAAGSDDGSSGSGSPDGILLLINGQRVQSDVPPKIVADRTVVPARVVTEALGAEVEWDGDSRQVTITFGSITVLLTIDDATAYVNSQAVTLDVPAFIESDRTMVPLRFISEAIGARVGWNEDTRTVTVDLAPGGQGFPGNGNGHDGETIVTGVRFGSTADEGGPGLFIYAEGPITPTIFTLEDPHRLVIDIPEALAGRNLAAVTRVDSPYAARIRTSQFEDDKVRVVADLHREAGFTPRIGADGLTIRFHGELQNVSLDSADGIPVVHLSGDAPLGYRVDHRGDQVVIDLPYVILGMEAGTLSGNSGLIDSVIVSGAPADSGYPASRVVLDLTGSGVVAVQAGGPEGLRIISPGHTDVPYDDGDDGGAGHDGDAPGSGGEAGGSPGGGSGSGHYSPGDLSGSNLAGKTIVVDAGHGGRDPGTISGSVYEKYLALDIAFYLQNILEQAGARVVMTRSSDVFVDLYDRAYIANDAWADVFVSIHLNAFHHSQMMGSQTYHYPGSRSGERLAGFVQSAMLRNLKRPDREVRSANFVVLRETTMPAILVEPVFLTNPEEDQMVRDPDFQWMIAWSVYEGLNEYFR